MKNQFKLPLMVLIIPFILVIKGYSQRVVALTGATDSKPSQMFLADRITSEGNNEVILQGNVLEKDPMGIFPPAVLLRNISCNDAKSILGPTFTVVCGSRVDCPPPPSTNDIGICCTPSSSFCIAWYAQNY